MNNKRFFQDQDVQRAILSAIAAKPTGSITAHELRNAVADGLATQITPAFLRAFRRNVRRMLLNGELTSRSLGAVFTGAK
jgi:hypothetical protein